MGTSFWEKTKSATLQVQVKALFSTQKYEDAIEKAEEALRLDPNNIAVQILLGRAASAVNYRHYAIATFEDVIRMNAGGNTKQLVEASRELALAYESDHRISEALKVWEDVIKYVPGDSDAARKIRALSLHIGSLAK